MGLKPHKPSDYPSTLLYILDEVSELNCSSSRASYSPLNSLLLALYLSLDVVTLHLICYIDTDTHVDIEIDISSYHTWPIYR